MRAVVDLLIFCDKTAATKIMTDGARRGEARRCPGKSLQFVRDFFSDTTYVHTCVYKHTDSLALKCIHVSRYFVYRLKIFGACSRAKKAERCAIAR